MDSISNNKSDFINNIIVQKANWDVYLSEFKNEFDLKLKSIKNNIIKAIGNLVENFNELKNITFNPEIIDSDSAAIEIATKSNIVFLLTLFETNLHIIQKRMINTNPNLIFNYNSPKMADFNCFIVINNNIVLNQEQKDLWNKINNVYRPIRNAIVHNFSNISSLKNEKQIVLDFINKHSDLIHIQNDNIWFETNFVKKITNDIYLYLDFLFDAIIKQNNE